MCCLAEGLAKLFLFVFNTVFFIIGVALVGIGAFVLVDDSYILSAFSYVPETVPVSSTDVQSILDGTSFLKSAAYILIAVGAFVLLIGFCGCCGACCKNRCMLGTYAFVVLLIFIIQVAGGAVAWVFRTKAETYLNDYLTSTITYTYNGEDFIGGQVIAVSTDTITLAWDTMQLQLGCCGVTNYTDYASAEAWTASGAYTYDSVAIAAVIPPSCCQVNDGSLYPVSVTEITPMTTWAGCMETGHTGANLGGCVTTVKEQLMNYSLWVMIAGIGLGTVELLGVVFACCLCKAYKKEDEDYA